MGKQKPMTEDEAQKEYDYLVGFDMAKPPKELGQAARAYVDMQLKSLEYSGFYDLAKRVRYWHNIEQR